MLWANMALHMASDPFSLLQRWNRVLKPNGFVMFSCFGPDTLRELRGLYQRMGWPEPAHEFTDMHDWGDMLVQVGFAEPVMDMERITLSFQTPERLLQELRELGRNLHVGRFAGLRGKGWLVRLKRTLGEQLRRDSEDGQLCLSFEIVYGHAFKPAPRLGVAAQTVVSLDEMRQALAAGKSRKPFS
jgi:malonyl-CoA O-methyltransferase